MAACRCSGAAGPALPGAAGRYSGRATSVLASGRGVGQPPAARLAQGWAQASGQEGSFKDHAGPCPPSLFLSPGQEPGTAKQGICWGF